MTAAMPLVDKVAKYDLPRAVRPTYVRRYFARKDFCRATQTAPSDKYFGVIPPERCPGKTKFYTFAAYLRHALPAPAREPVMAGARTGEVNSSRMDTGDKDIPEFLRMIRSRSN